MKIAIPVKMNRENPPVAPLFGKAKWFALIENGKTEIKANPAKGGQAVIEWFADEKVDTIIMQEMGISPYQMIQSHGGMKIYHSGFERILLDEVLQKFESNELEVLDDAKMQEIIASHEGKHSRDNRQ
ncbi:MAG: NifB/NifX family molybdenum-iron cluster-binding protein [Sulfurimonas sp.]